MSDDFTVDYQKGLIKCRFDDRIAYSLYESDDAILKRLIAKHIVNGKALRVGDDGYVYFMADGTLVLKDDLPGLNTLDLAFWNSNKFDSCEEAIGVLEKIKHQLDVLEEKIYELSLMDNVGQSGEH